MSNRALTASLLTIFFAGGGFSAPFQVNWDSQSLNSSEQVLVEGSKRVIISTGVSAEYFNEHFKLNSVVDKPADRRVVWRFSVNGYDALITDSIGFALIATKRLDIHSAATALGRTSEIQRTISRGRALKIMLSCIGNFEKPAVEYGAVDGHAQLLLVAQARKPANNRSKGSEADERESTVGREVIKAEESDDRTPIVFGNVNLESGKCTKGAGLIAP